MATVGSLLKSAHLMMFFLLGYRYALSPGGWFLGHHVLGSFFRKFANAGRRAALDAAEAHFRPFSGLVRRIHSPRGEVNGTLGSRELYWCTEGDKPWAFVPVIPAGGHLYAVVVPTLCSAKCEARFREMLRAPHLPLDAQPMTLYRDEWNRGSGGTVCLAQM
jgi:hypothetical protein